ncbi:MAG: hypothetical protein M1835_007235 [Candelina submexicana]|nr:MAG: hypothetical protein M1835_007235 [Candelina submexicana]
MSGNHASSNPFRRKLPVAEPPSVTKHGGSDIDRPFLLQKDSPKQVTRKQVRIKTPPSRYDEWSQSTPTSTTFGQSSPDGYSPSTASDSSTSPDGSPDELPIDSTHHLLAEEEEGPEDEELLRNTRRNSFTSAPVSQSTQQRPPLNPFSTTSATLEDSPTDASDCSEVASPIRPKLSTRQESGSARPSLDVDSFKRLLLTGNASQSMSAQSTASAPPSAQLHMQPGIPGDSGSSTDASSISRQSIFEQTLDVSHDTPSSSHNTSPSENEQRRSWTETPPIAERKKPPPPKSRHGKRETPAPQNVPFEGSPALNASVAALSSPQPHPFPYEPVSSANKVLPAPPTAQFPINEPTAQEFNGDIASQTLPQEPPYPLPTPQKRVPPPPPLARRQTSNQR